jgi:glutamate-ammonia-ligase adenylyltransferase
MPPEPLGCRLTALPASPFSDKAHERLREAAERQSATELLSQLCGTPGIAGFLGSALGDSPYLLDLAAPDLARLAAILEQAPEVRVEAQVAELRAARWASKAEAMAALRRAKQNVALTLGLADLARAIPLDAVTASLTGFADAALDAALRFALSEMARLGKWAGGEEATGFTVLAMGKYGAHELNYSSDIDLIALYEPDAPGPTGEPADLWVRVVRMLVALLQERTQDGYVFRTDLRLRPDPGATPVAISAPAALLYYESMGQNWERAALIKARACAGDVKAGEGLLAEIAPFIWRKYLDFAAIADIHSIKRQVHAHRGHEAVTVRGHDIKRGRGGIREIEFFVQTQQLIAGGREPKLRGRGTRPMLARLAAQGWIDEPARVELDAAYETLRMVEHRLQMLHDEQTHIVPDDDEDFGRVARLMGHADPAEFEAELRSVLERVAIRYSELFEAAPDLSAEAGSLVFTGGEDDPETIETLRRLGFQSPETVTQTVRGWHFGRFAAMRSTAAREGLTEVTPALLSAFSRAGNPDAGLRAFDSLLKALPAGAQLFALLNKNQELLDLLATILAAAPRLAEVFARRPHVVDAMIDLGAGGEIAGLEAMRERLRTSLADAKGYEDALNRTRLFAAEQRFLISVRLLQMSLPTAAAGRAFSDLAEAVIDELYGLTLAEFERQHGRLAGGRSAILGFGRLGSREMTAGSDLDLIIIYDHDKEATASDGRRPLAPSQYYARLTQRIVAALSAPTAEGIAYPVDLRLRPSGRQGPLATHIEAFEHYQANEAWTWEHMAMSRGRAIAGDAGLCGQVETVLQGIAAKPRERETLARDIAEMRARLERDKPAANLFDLKRARGGLVDCEFAAQYLVLAGLGRAAGETTPETLRRGEAAGVLTAARGEALLAAAELQAGLLQALRIANGEHFDPEAAPEALKRLLVGLSAGALAAHEGPHHVPPATFAELEARLAEHQAAARAALEAVLGRPIG